MHREIREGLLVGILVLPVAVVVNGVGFIFMLATESYRNGWLAVIGYLAIPFGLGFAIFSIVARSRPRAARLRDATLFRPCVIYMFLVLVGAWLWMFSDCPGFGLVAPIVIAPIAASVAGIAAIVIWGRPLRTA